MYGLAQNCVNDYITRALFELRIPIDSQRILSVLIPRLRPLRSNVLSYLQIHAIVMHDLGRYLSMLRIVTIHRQTAIGL